MLNISNDLLSVVELYIMWVVVLVGILILVEVIKWLILPVSVTFVASSSVVDWLVDVVVEVEVGVMFDTVGVMVLWVHWMECMTV